MQPRGPRRLLLVLLLLTAAFVSVLAAEAWRPRPSSEPFQRVVGGLGFGPALTLDDCPFGFDPRLDGTCGADHGPIPGGSCFCPRHAGSILPYHFLDRFTEQGDGLSP